MSQNVNHFRVLDKKAGTVAAETLSFGRYVLFHGFIAVSIIFFIATISLFYTDFESTKQTIIALSEIDFRSNMFILFFVGLTLGIVNYIASPLAQTTKANGYNSPTIDQLPIADSKKSLPIHITEIQKQEIFDFGHEVGDNYFVNRLNRDDDLVQLYQYVNRAKDYAEKHNISNRKALHLFEIND